MSGKLAKPKLRFAQALAMRKKLLGDQHPSVADSQRDLAKVLALQDKSGSSGTGL